MEAMCLLPRRRIKVASLISAVAMPGAAVCSCVIKAVAHHLQQAIFIRPLLLNLQGIEGQRYSSQLASGLPMGSLDLEFPVSCKPIPVRCLMSVSWIKAIKKQH